MGTTSKITYRNMALNGLALFVLAVTLTAPVHEAVHMLTKMAVGCTPVYLAFGVTESVGEFAINTNSTFWKIMLEGSAALFNVVVGLVLSAVLFRCRLNPLGRQFVLLLALLHLCMGFGYFLRDGFIYSPGNGMGDWSKVLDRFDGSLPLRIGMLVVGSAGYLFAMFLAFREAFRFIEHRDDKTERSRVTSTLYLWPYLFNVVFFTAVNLVSPLPVLVSLVISGSINLFGYFPLFIGYLYAGKLLKPPARSLYYFSPCAEAKPVLWVASIAVLVFDALVLCPGIYF